MERRTYLAGAGGTLAALAGGTVVAKATRADISASTSLVRGRSVSVTATRTVSRDSLEYVEATGDVRSGTTTESFEHWARQACGELGGSAALSAIEDRFDTPVEGVGRGTKSLLFGSVVTVDHVVVHDGDGSVMSEPNVAFEDLVAVTPRTVTATVLFEGHDYTRELPVIVRHDERRLN